MADPKTRKVVVVMGPTGSGKSALCNILAGNALFQESDNVNSCTYQTHIQSANWLGSSQSMLFSFTLFYHYLFPHLFQILDIILKLAELIFFFFAEAMIIDTPGHGDSGGRDSEHISAMVDSLKGIQYATAFIILFNGQSPRYDEPLQSMLNTLVQVSFIFSHFFFEIYFELRNIFLPLHNYPLPWILNLFLKFIMYLERFFYSIQYLLFLGGASI